MKELSIEQKAKAYDEAIEKAQDILHSSEIVKITDIFPELKESEDERIRKELITFIKKRDRSGCDYDYDKWIAWLEKQGESYTKRDVDDAFVEGMALAKDELEKQGEKKSSDEVLKIRQELYQSGYNDGYKHGCEDTKKQGEQNLANSAKTCKKSQRMISAEAKEALYDKPAWSEEDEEMLDGIILRCEKYGHQEQINWLKSLKQRIKGE